MENLIRVMMVAAALAATGGGLVVAAEEAPCVRQYREGHGEFLNLIDDLTDERNSAMYGAAAFGSLAYAACAYKTKAYGACGALLGGVALAGGAYSYEAQQRLLKLEDDRRIYELYLQLDKSGELKTLAQWMESGELCPGGKTMSWEELKEKFAGG